MLDTVMVGAIATAVGSVIGVVGKISVDIIKAKKEPDQSDLELKDELEREKDKNNAAIERFTNVTKELTAAVEDLRTDFNKRMDDSDKKFVEVNQRIDEMDKRIEEYRNDPLPVTIEEKEKSSQWEILKKYVFTNPYVWYLSLALCPRQNLHNP